MVAAGGVTFLLTGYALIPTIAEDAANPENARDLVEKKFNAWVHIRTDGRILIYNPAAEMGQGSMTALPLLVAEEMDADWSMVQIEHAPIEPSIYGSPGFGGRMLTVGSRTLSGYYNSLRQAGAQLRQILLRSVADHWSVPVKELHTEPSLVVHQPSGRKISYGEIAQFTTAPGQLPEILEKDLKNPGEFRLIGNETVPRYDIPAKVDGSARYAMDVRLPDMVYGVITRSPVHGAKPSLLNEAAIRALPGVIDVVALDHGIGLIAESIEKALAIKPRLQIEWSDDAKAISHNSRQAYEDYVRILDSETVDGRTIAERGDVNQGLRSALKTYTADYKNDYVYHAQMEPLNAVVSVAPDGKSAEVWVGSQSTDGARSAAAGVLGLDTEQVTLHACYLGGGFGRRSMSDNVEEAALLAKELKRPLKLLWTREDDVQYGSFRPISLQRLQAGVDEQGNITAWRHTIIGPGDRLLASGAEIPFYDIPHQRIEVRAEDHGVRTKHWRAVGHGPNKYAIECFIDEIAAEQKIDPLEMRKKLMKNSPRALKVLQTVAEMANWGTAPAEGRAKGIAFGERSGSLSAGACEISVDETSGKLKVHRFWAAIDAGVVVQPDNVIAQMEGGILMGLSSVLHESITFKNGRVEQSNFHDYSLLRMADMPESVEVKIIPSEESPTGVGESGVPIVAGAVANAFAGLTGKWLKHLPFTPEKVLAVMQG